MYVHQVRLWLTAQEAEGRRRGYEVQLEQLHAELELYNKAKDAAQARMTETEEELERLAPERIRHIVSRSHWKKT